MNSRLKRLRAIYTSMVIETNISMSPRKSCSQSVQNSLYDMLKKFTNIRSSTDIN